MTATRDSWKSQSFGYGLPIPYNRRFSASEFAKLRAGLVPQTMDDKWFVYYAEPHLFFHRSWGGQGIYRVSLKTDGDAVVVKEALCAEHVLQNSRPGYEAALLDFLIGNLLLGEAKDFPMPPSRRFTASGLLQHVIAGTSRPEASLNGFVRQPWWAIWRRR